MKIICKDIFWDTDGQETDLPDTVEIDDPTDEMIEDWDGSNGVLADYLSDKYEFCVKDFRPVMAVSNGWSEIRCDYLCEDRDDRFWRVDAWKTDDDNEEGKVIAYIDDLTLRVLYIDPVARTDEYAQEVIRDRIEELREEKSVSDRVHEWLAEEED